MATTKINTDIVLEESSKAGSAKNIVVNASMAVPSILRRTDGRILGRNGIAGSFRNIQNILSGIETDITRIYQSANAAASSYRSTEYGILNEGRRIGELARVKSANTVATDNRAGFEACFRENGLNFKELVTASVEEAGILGTAISGISDIVEGFDKTASKSDKYKALLGGCDKFVACVGDLAEEAFKTSEEVDLKAAFFGDWSSGSAMENLDEILKNYPNKNRWSAVVSDEIESYTFKNATTVGDKIKVGTKWAGTIVTVATNAIDNYEEHGDLTTRFWAETITETAVDVLFGATATATATVAVSAAATALGVAAPAVAVGVAAVGITWAADTLVKAVTQTVLGEEKDLTETVSDIALDIGEAVIDKGKNVFDKIKNGINNISINWSTCLG